MKSLNLKEVTRLSALVLVLTFALSFPALAQNNANTARTDDNRRTERNDNVRTVDRDDDTDWGWLGLLGLLGLAGLLPKRRSIEVAGVRDANENRPAS